MTRTSIDMKRRLFEKNKNANKGSTIITVIVAIAFVTILTSIVLGSSVVNMRMKAIDRKSKDNFYFAEKALNDIYAGLGQETAQIAADEYEKEFKKLGKDDDYELSDKAENEYRKNFIKETAVKLGIPDGSVDMTATKTMLAGYIVPVSGITYTVDGIKDYFYEKYDGSNPSKSKDGAERIRLVGVQVTAKDTANDFQATISTDIIIELPTMDFLSANVDVTDYSIIANKGLYINGKATINGNVYAGIHKKNDSSNTEKLPSADFDDAYLPENIYGGINIKGAGAGAGKESTFYGNYIVSKGDINLSGDHPALIVGKEGVSDANLPNIYFDTLRTCRKSDTNQASLTKNTDAVKLNANVFALNDLELNADNSKVTIRGNYYGYNDKTLPDPSMNFSSFSAESGHDDADSSAIIINGSHSTLDMSGIRSLVLMGRAYVDFAEGASGGESLDDSSNVAATAEAVALKTNQQLYLVPADLLESPNPVVEDAYGSGFSLIEVKKTLEDGTEYTDKKIKDWFGYDFVNNDDSDVSKTFKTYKVTLSDGSTVVYYAYLNFNNKLWKKDSSVTLPTKENHFGYTEYTGGVLGTEGSVSSMEAFFDIIMNSEHDRHEIIEYEKTHNGKTENEARKEYETQMGATPSPYTVYSRVKASMGYNYFDLQDCVIGDENAIDTSAIIYSQNSIIRYQTEKNAMGAVKINPETNEPIFEKIIKKDNNVGMERYAAYPQNLFHRYQWLATQLNAVQDVNLENDPNADVKYSGRAAAVQSEWKGTDPDYKGYYKYTESGDPYSSDAPPLCHFAALNKIIEKGVNTIPNVNDAVDRGMPRTSYGDCIVKSGDLNIGSVGGDFLLPTTSTFKGVAIVDGNITVKSGTTVNGLLMATGVIVLEDDVTINYDKGLLQARIEKEIANVKSFPDSEPAGSTDTVGLKTYYLINYLTQNRPAHSADETYLMYKVTEGSKKKVDRIEPDYHSFMFYENWQKGPVN